MQATTEGLWIFDQATNRVALVRYDDGKVLREFATDTDQGSGITWDGEALWIASTYNRLLVRIDPRNGETLKKFASPGSGVVKWGPRSAHPQPTGAHGLEWRDGELWVANPPSATIYVMSPDGWQGAAIVSRRRASGRTVSAGIPMGRSGARRASTARSSKWIGRTDTFRSR